MKCNLDCSYCIVGHDNSTRHPALARCLASIDFMFEYVDLYMTQKIRSLKHVVLNVYGGESLHHPDIVTILQQVKERYKPYQDRWHLTVTTTTNAIVSDRKLHSIIPLIDEFTVSYHTENTHKQKQQFKKNLLTIKNSGRRLKCITLMHSDPDLFADAQGMIDWLAENNIRHLPRQLDHSRENSQFNYQPQQVMWLQKVYDQKSYQPSDEKPNLAVDSRGHVNMADSGRACCGGRQLCQDQNYRSREFFVNNKFPDWYCSVNHFFLSVRQLTEEIFVNKDCQMRFDGTIGSIGTVAQADKLLSWTRQQLQHHTMPVIQCKKTWCECGVCAPKSPDLTIYNHIMEKYHT